MRGIDRIKYKAALGLFLASIVYGTYYLRSNSDVYVKSDPDIMFEECPGISYGITVPDVLADATALDLIKTTVQTSVVDTNNRHLVDNQVPLRPGTNELVLGYAPSRPLEGKVVGNASVLLGNVKIYSFSETEPFSLDCKLPDPVIKQ